MKSIQSRQAERKGERQCIEGEREKKNSEKSNTDESDGEENSVSRIEVIGAVVPG